MSCAVVADGYAYIAIDALPSRIVKIDLKTFSRADTLFLSSQDGVPRSGVVIGNQAYFGTSREQAPAAVVQIDLQDFERVGSLVLEPGEAASTSVEGSDGFLYVTGSTSNRIVKIDPSSLTRAAALDGTDGAVVTAFASEGFVYFVTNLSRVVRVDLASFTRRDTLALGSNEGIRCAVVSGDFAYLGGNGRIVKIDLGAFERQGSVAVASGGISAALFTAAVDDRYAYFGGAISTFSLDYGVVERLDLATFTLAPESTVPTDWRMISAAGDAAYFVESTHRDFLGLLGSPARPLTVIQTDTESFDPIERLTLASGEDFLSSAVVSGQFIYFGTNTSPGRIVKVDRATWRRVGVLELEPGEDGLSCAVLSGSHAYFGTSTSPARVIKIDLQSFTRVGALPLQDASYLSDAVAAGDFAYVVSSTQLSSCTGSSLVEIDLRSFAQTRSMSLPSACTAVAEGYSAFFGTGSGEVIEVDLTRFESIGSLSLPDFVGIRSATIQEGFGYFADHQGNLAKVDLRDLTEVGSLHLGRSVLLNGAVLSGDVGYFGSCTAEVIRIDLERLQLLPALPIAGAHGCLWSATSADGEAYFGAQSGASFGGAAVKLVLGSQRGVIKATRAVLRSPSTLGSVSLYVHPGQGRVRLALYDSKKNLLWQSKPTRLNGSESVLTIPIGRGIPGSLGRLPAGTYYLAWQVDSSQPVPSYARGQPGEGWSLSQPFGPFPTKVTGATRTREVWTEYASN